MPAPTLTQIHVDAALTNTSVAWFQDSNHYIAHQVFPVVPTAKKSNKYHVYDRGDLYRRSAGKRAPNTESAKTQLNISQNSYDCTPWANHMDLSDQEEVNADESLIIKTGYSQRCMQSVLIEKEIDFTSKFLATGVWNTDITGAASPHTNQTHKWSDVTNGDPIGDIETAQTAVLQQTGFEANTLVLSYDTWQQLKKHPEIVDRVKYNQTIGTDNAAKVSPNAIANLFFDGVMNGRVLISKAVFNNALANDPDNMQYINSGTALLCYTPKTPGLLEPAAGYTFTWTGYLNAQNSFGIATSQFYIPQIKATRVECELAVDHNLVSKYLGYFFTNMV